MDFSDLLQIANDILHFKLFTVNQTPITVSSLLIFLALFSGLLLLSRFVSGLLASKVLSNPKDQYKIRSEINCAIVQKFRESDIEIPFLQRDLHVRTPLPLPLSTNSMEGGNGDTVTTDLQEEKDSGAKRADK